MIPRLFLGACLAASLLPPARAENLLQNSGFQLGTADYACVRFMQVPGETRYLPPQADAPAQAPAAGTVALRFDNPTDDSIDFRTHEFPVAPGSSNAFSVWLKGDRADTPVRLGFYSVAREGRKQDWDNAQSTTVHVGPEWKRYVLPMTAKAGHAYFFAEASWGGDGGGSPGATVWLDAPQVNGGKEALAYQPAADVECAFSATGYLALDGQTPPEFAFAAVNHGARPVHLDAAFRATDTLFGKTRDLPPVALDLPPGQAGRAKLAAPLEAKGGFRVEGSWRAGALSGDVPFPLHYAVSGIAAVAAPDLSRDFSLGMDEDFDIAPRQYLSPRPFAYRSLEAGIGERFQFLEREGVRLARVGNTGGLFFAWCQIEPEEGRFDWALTDFVVDQAEKHGIKLLPVLGGAFSAPRTPSPPAWNNKLPAWLVAKSTPFPWPDWGSGNIVAEKPPLADWARFVSAVVSRYKGRITHYEILNEPNLWLPAEDYARYLQTAYEEAKKADPGCSIVGFCSTGDLGGQMKAFLKACGDLGAFRYADAVSFHPYDAPNDDSPIRAPDQIRGLRKLVDSYRPGLPLWCTELYYLSRGDGDSTPIQPDALARRALIDLGEGVSQSSTILADRQLVNGLQPHWGYMPGDVCHALIPSAVYPATAALANLLAGGHPAGAVHWGDNLLCYLYADRAGRPVAACWARSEKGRATVTFPAGVQALDLFGNRLPGPAVSLGRVPVYLQTGLSPEAFRKGLEAAPVVPEYPCVATGARYSSSAGAPAVAVEVANNTDRPQAPRVRLDGSPVGPLSGGVPDPLMVPPHGTATVYFPIPSPGVLRDGPASVAVEADSRSIALPLPMHWGARTSSGGWSGTADGSRVVRGAGQWGGKDDLSFAVCATAAADALAIVVRVKEGKRWPRPADAAAWDGDAVEFFVDPRPDRALDHPDYFPDTVHAVVAPKSGDGAAARLEWVTSPIGAARWECKDIPGGYEASLTLPWSALGRSGPGPVGLDIAADGSDGAHRRCQIAWCGHGDSYKNRLEFGHLLVAPPRP